MLSTGIRTPVGVKVLGTDLAKMEKLARQIEAVIRTVPGTTSAYAERVIGGYYLNIDPDRAQLARYGLMVGDLQNLIAMALGAEPVTTAVEGRERYTVSIRYPRAWLVADPRVGTVGIDSVTVTLRLNPRASKLSPQAYEAPVTFINVTNGQGTTRRTAKLTVEPSSEGYLLDNSGGYLLDNRGERLRAR
jgi:hypothetical protein